MVVRNWRNWKLLRPANEDIITVRNDAFSYDSQLRAEGKAEERLGMAKRMIEDGEPNERIARYTGLAIEEIEALRIKMRASSSAASS